MSNKICAIVKDDFIYVKKQVELVPHMSITPHAPISCLTAARGKDIYGGTAYCSILCCAECAKALGLSGIKKIVYTTDRPEGNAATEEIAAYYEIELVKNEKNEMSVEDE